MRQMTFKTLTEALMFMTDEGFAMSSVGQWGDASLGSRFYFVRIVKTSESIGMSVPTPHTIDVRGGEYHCTIYGQSS